MATKFTFGADPELFVYDNERKHYIGAHELKIPGTKDKPFPIPNGAILIDGTAIEFNVDPTDDPELFAKRTVGILEHIRKTYLGPHQELRCSPAIEYPLEYWKTIPDSCKELGCSPSFNVNSRQLYVPAGRPESMPTLCTSGGHIHIGFTKDAKEDDDNHVEDCGIVCSIVESLFDSLVRYSPENVRSNLYGLRGDTRIKSYGVEVRSLDASWVFLPEIAMAGLFKYIKYCLQKAEEGERVYAYLLSWHVDIFAVSTDVRNDLIAKGYNSRRMTWA